MKRRPKDFTKRELIRKHAYALFLVENSDIKNTVDLQYAFEQGFLAGQLHEIDNNVAAFKRISEELA